MDDYQKLDLLIDYMLMLGYDTSKIDGALTGMGFCSSEISNLLLRAQERHQFRTLIFG